MLIYSKEIFFIEDKRLICLLKYLLLRQQVWNLLFTFPKIKTGSVGRNEPFYCKLLIILGILV